MMCNRKRGQAILEYALLLGAVVAVIVVAIIGSGNNSIKNRVSGVYSKMGNVLEDSVDDLSASVFSQ